MFPFIQALVQVLQCRVRDKDLEDWDKGAEKAVPESNPPERLAYILSVSRFESAPSSFVLIPPHFQ
jgi:hypothetical protein